MRLGLFGGTFDPVHFGHLLLAECCREQCRLDAVWFLPTAVPPHKQDRPPTPAELRIEMLELATAGNEAMAVSRYEADRGGVNYTAQTLEHFHQEDPQRELFFLLGADMLRDLPHWREPGRICALALPVAVRRSGRSPLDFGPLAQFVPPERIESIRDNQVEMPEIGISSTEDPASRRRGAEHSLSYPPGGREVCGDVWAVSRGPMRRPTGRLRCCSAAAGVLPLHQSESASSCNTFACLSVRNKHAKPASAMLSPTKHTLATNCAAAM